MLVTGHTGFKGAWLTLWLQHLGAAVSGLALDPEHPEGAFTAMGPWPDLDDRRVDLRDAPAVRKAVADLRPEVVLHLAAQPLVRRGYREPVETFAVNVMGAAHLLDAVRDLDGVRAVLVVTSDKVYAPPPPPAGYREEDTLGGVDPYSASKACAELLVRSWRAAVPAGPRLATARAGNVLGGGDTAEDRLVPDVLAALSAGRPVMLRHPGATRPWQFVLEPLRGYLMFAQRLLEDADHPLALNFGPPRQEGELPVAAVVELLNKLAGRPPEWVGDASPQPHEAEVLRLNAGRAGEVLGWYPRTTVEDALRWTLAWDEARRRGEDMRRFSLGQLEEYLTVAGE